MLVLTRRTNESIIINGNIRITVTSIEGRQVRLGIEAPRSIGIFRQELCLDINPDMTFAGAPAGVGSQDSAQASPVLETAGSASA